MKLNPVLLVRIVNPLIWIGCGLAVIGLRGIFFQGQNILTWWAIGGIMVTYGAVRLVLNLVRTIPPRTTANQT